LRNLQLLWHPKFYRLARNSATIGLILSQLNPKPVLLSCSGEVRFNCSLKSLLMTPNFSVLFQLRSKENPIFYIIALKYYVLNEEKWLKQD
jgi:hypothetical protein